MSEFTIIVAVVVVGVPVVFAGIVAIILVAGRSRPRADLGIRHGDAPPPTGRWNAQVLSNSGPGRIGGTLGALSGQFEVTNGELHFFARKLHPGTPLWTLPCRDLTARAHGMLSTAGVELWSQHGHLRCNVSREHINAFVTNSLKSMREPRYAREFVDTLVAQGARRG